MGRHRPCLDAEGVTGGQPALLDDVAARLGKPMTSPAAKMCGTVVQNVSSTFSRPRSSARRPAAPRISRSVADTRPAENSTTSADDPFAGFEQQHAPRRRARLHRDRGHRLAQPERDVATAHLVEQLVHDLTVEEFQRPVAALDEGHGHAERGEHRGVLDTDHPGAHHGQRARQLLHRGHVVTGEDDLAVGGDAGGRGRTGADGDDDAGRAHRVGAVADDLQAVRIDERGFALEQGDVVALQLVFDDRRARASSTSSTRSNSCAAVGRPSVRIRRRGSRTPPVPVRKMTASRSVLLGIVPVSTHTPPTQRRLLDHRDPLAELGGLHGGPLAGRPTADDRSGRSRTFRSPDAPFLSDSRSWAAA